MYKKKHNKKVSISDRPAYVAVAELEEPIINGYTLWIDLNKPSMSIINLKKGGQIGMPKTIYEPKEGYEDVFELVSAKKANLETEKQAAIQEAVAKVEAEFEKKLETYNVLFNEVAEAHVVEEPEEVLFEQTEAEEEHE